MDFDLNEQQAALRTMVRDFAEKEIAPVAQELDDKEEFPYGLVKKMGELGLMGLYMPEEYGGGGADALSFAIATEELARVDASVAVTPMVSQMAGLVLAQSGSEAQKRRWLPPLARGEIIGAFGLTEPGAGSDAGATQTAAVLQGGQWVINGTKCFITNSGTDITGFVIITAVTGKRGGHSEISAILVPQGTPGYTQAKGYKKLGWHASDTHELAFVDCRVPEENLVGEKGRGFHQFLRALDTGRITVASLGVGL
ncbi:MAG: acyl-CoA dehydrogenase family protein, partial [Chloroflexota bacterium]|nr:acyl-CoA dehydrogenase family protein [Chloroflexota bacterium]